MSKNMIQKALAAGSGVALVSALFVASPAAAAGEVTLAVDGGTGTTTILGEAFSLKATVGALVPSSAHANVAFSVSNGTGATLTYVGTGGESPSTSTGVSDTVTVTTQGQNQGLSISSAAAAAHSVSVVAFLDADGDGKIGPSEFQSNAITINFVEFDDAGLQVAMKSTPQLGDTTYVAKVTSSIVNVAQIVVANVGVQVGRFVSGTKTAIDSGYVYGTLTGGALSANGIAVTLNTDKDALETAVTTPAALTPFIAASYIATAIYSPDPGTTAWEETGTEIGFGLAAAEANVAESKDSVTVVPGSVNSSGAVLEDYKGDVNYVVNIKDSDKDNLSGRIVRLTATTVTGTWSVNGDSTVASADVFEATTDASGNAIFVVKSTSAAVGDLITVGDIVSEGVVVEAAADSADIAYAAAVFVAKETTPGVVSQAVNATAAVNDGAAHTMTFSVKDQFGNSFADSAYRMKATATGRTVTTLTDNLGDGFASFTIVDGANTSGDTTVALSFEKLASGVHGASSDISAVTNRTISYYDQTNKVVITQAAATAVVALEVAKAGDSREHDFTATTFAVGETIATLSGSVTNSVTSALQAGALVTISGDSSLLFNVGDVYSFGSLSFYDADGTLTAGDINIFSNKAHENTVVTVTTSNGGSDTVKVSFTGVAATAGTSLVIDAPASVQAGSTLQIVGTLTDKFGNAVISGVLSGSDRLKVAVEGAGITLTALPTTTDAKGQFVINRLLGANDTSGLITITASYDINADGDLTDEGDLEVVRTINVGTVASTDTKVNAGSFKGFVAVYARGYEGQRLSAKIGNDWVIVDPIVNNQENGTLFRVTDFTGAGVNISVRIYIDRVLTATIPLVTK